MELSPNAQVWQRYLHKKREKCVANLEIEKFVGLGGAFSPLLCKYLS